MLAVMPLALATVNALAANVPAGTHVVNVQATRRPRTAAFQAQVDASCENFAVAALQGGGLLPSTVFGDILMGGGAPGWLPALHPQFAMASAIKNSIRGLFGAFGAETFQPAPPWSPNPFATAHRDGVALRNGQRQQLHNWAAAVFEHCLTVNGFTLSGVATNYMVCTEYECAADAPMYPNHTHSWLMYNHNRTIQTVTGAYISASRHHAGHQPHCGFIRRYVTDFHANQIAIIDTMMLVANRMQTNNDVTGCNLGVDIGTTAPQPLNELSPNEG
jgi:hypothetical protein